MPLHPATCPLDCPDACGVLVETETDGSFVRVRGNPDHSWSKGHLCGKTALYGELVTSPDRLRRPLVREGGSFREASWEEALTLVAERVKPLRPGEILALEYAGNMGQVARKFPLRIMNALGAALHDGGVCDNTATEGFETVLGRVVGCDLEQIDDADLVLVWGADLARTVQHLQPPLLRLAKAGVPVVVIDVYRTETMKRFERLGGHGLVIRPGSDAMLALGLTRRLFELESADEGFLRDECVGSEEFREHVLAGHGTDDVLEVTGLTGERFETLLELFRQAERPLVKVGVGWTRRRNGALGMRAVCSLCAVKGCVDRLHYESFAHFGLRAEGLTRDDLRPEGAPTESVRQVALGEPLARGDWRAVFVWGHNPAVTLPDSRRIREGLARDDVFVVVHEAFLTETAQLADVVLPAANFVEEWEVTRSYGHRTLQFARPACAPPGEARSNVDAFRALGKVLGLPRECWDVTAEGLCRELLDATRERFTAEEWERLLAHEPVKLLEAEHEGRGTPSGKVELASERFEPRCATYVPDAKAGHGRADDEAFALIGAPSRATHNSTFAHSPRHVARAGPPKVYVHPEDVAELGLEDGALARLSNRHGALTLPVEGAEDMPRGVVRIDGLPRAVDLPEGVGLNSLVGNALSEQAFGNTLYSTRVNLAPADR